jgi:hypothetical protein
MNWELYEVWAEDEAGQEELIETTNSRKQAFELAQAQLDLGYIASIVYLENEEGDLERVKRFEHS